MASRKSEFKRPDITGRPLVMSDFSPEESEAAIKAVEGSALPGSQTTTYSGFVQNRKNAFINAATSHTRLPGEDIAGAEFYFEHANTIRDVQREHPSDVPFGIALEAAGQLSTRNKPEREKASLGQLLQGHAQGSVTFSEQLLSGIHEYDKKAVDERNRKKLVRETEKGKSPESIKLETPYQAPFDLAGKTIPFSEVEGAHIAAISSPHARSSGAQESVSGVDLTQLGRTGMHNVRAEAQDIIREQKATDPHTNPKHYGYVESHKLAVDDPNVLGEYRMRMMHLGKVARGESAGGQEMFDFYGLRDSNEGILSNEAPTAEDSWMKAVSFNKFGEIKRGGDTKLTAKQLNENSVMIGAGDTRISPLAIEHAVHHQATVDAAKGLQEDLGVSFTVPSIAVQETAWAHTRRDAGGDDAFNALTAPPKEDKKKKTPRVNPQQFEQLSLFD